MVGFSLLVCLLIDLSFNSVGLGEISTSKVLFDFDLIEVGRFPCIAISAVKLNFQ